MNWYGVKTLYRTVAQGRPRNRDEQYDGSVASVEERVVLFSARSASSALSKAVTEARKYARMATWLNAYGQTVRTEFLEAAECYDISDDLTTGTEVFSNLETVSVRETRRQIVARRMGDGTRQDVVRQFIAGTVSRGLDDALGKEWRKRPKGT